MKFKLPTTKARATAGDVIVKKIEPSLMVVGGVDIVFTKTAEFKAPEYEITITAAEIAKIVAARGV